VDRPAKVGHLYLPLHAQQQILWLDVAVDDVALVQVLQGQGNLGNIQGSALVAKGAFLA
jgi:hypothetical protein